MPAARTKPYKRSRYLQTVGGLASAAYSGGRYVLKNAKRAKQVLDIIRKVKTKKNKSSQTKQSTQRKPNYKIETYVANGDGMTKSYFIKSYPKMKSQAIIKQISNRDIFRKNGSGCMISNYGTQEASNLSNLLDCGEIVACWNFGISSNATVTAAGALALGNRGMSMWCDTVESTYLFTNHSPGCVFMTLYDIVPKVDNPADPNTCWTGGLNYTTGTGGSVSSTYWNSKPSDSILFNRTWKIEKVTKVEMHTGRSHMHTRKFAYNGLLPLEKAYSYGSGSVGLKGITRQTLCVIHGMVTSNVPAAVVDNAVTLDRVKVNYVYAESYKTRIMSLKGEHTEYTQNLNIAPSAAYSQNVDGTGTYDTVTNVVSGTTAFS